MTEQTTREPRAPSLAQAIEELFAAASNCTILFVPPEKKDTLFPAYLEPWLATFVCKGRTICRADNAEAEICARKILSSADSKHVVVPRLFPVSTNEAEVIEVITVLANAFRGIKKDTAPFGLSMPSVVVTQLAAADGPPVLPLILARGIAMKEGAIRLLEKTDSSNCAGIKLTRTAVTVYG